MKKLSPFALGFCAGTVTIAFLVLLYSFNSFKKTFEEITVKRINIIDEKGINRIVLSNEELMPPPIIKNKPYKRTLNPAGIIFYNEKGDECGGIAMSNNKKSSTYALAFDYNNADAIGILTQEDSQTNTYRSGIILNDKDMSGKIGSNINRINLITENNNSSLIINGPDEKPRIIIGVDSLGNPDFKMIDEQGKIIKQFGNDNKR